MVGPFEVPHHVAGKRALSEPRQQVGEWVVAVPAGAEGIIVVAAAPAAGCAEAHRQIAVEVEVVQIKSLFLAGAVDGPKAGELPGVVRSVESVD